MSAHSGHLPSPSGLLHLLRLEGWPRHGLAGGCVEPTRSACTHKPLVHRTQTRAPFCVPPSPEYNLRAVCKAPRDMLSEPQGRGGISVARDEQRRHGGAYGFPIPFGQSSPRPVLACGLLLACAIVAEKRAAGLALDVL